jgi:hypothetical protein
MRCVISNVLYYSILLINAALTALRIKGLKTFFLYGSTALYGPGPGPPRFVEVSRSHTQTHHTR